MHRVIWSSVKGNDYKKPDYRSARDYRYLFKVWYIFCSFSDIFADKEDLIALAKKLEEETGSKFEISDDLSELREVTKSSKSISTSEQVSNQKRSSTNPCLTYF